MVCKIQLLPAAYAVYYVTPAYLITPLFSSLWSKHFLIYSELFEVGKSIFNLLIEQDFCWEDPKARYLVTLWQNAMAKET